MLQDVTNDGVVLVVFFDIIFIFTKNQNDFVSMCQRCTESEIFDSDSAPPSAEYTPKHFKVLGSDSCLNSKVIYLKAVAIDTPVDLEI